MSKSNKTKAKWLVARHTQHGLSKLMGKKKHLITSIGTERNYDSAFEIYFDWCDLNSIHPDNFSNRIILVTYLEERSEWIKQKTLDQERQALEFIYRQKLPYIRSKNLTILEKRSYSLTQVESIILHQNEKNSLTTLLAFWSGLRAHEPATILPIDERPPSERRAWDPRRFLGFSEHKLYTVTGKGGLTRVVAVPLWLAAKLDTRRRKPVQVKDRGIYYESHYEVGFGQAWSQSFSSASKTALGFSTGGHGLRHSYAKWRLQQLIMTLEGLYLNSEQHNINEEALLILSQELGHFRLDITYCYLR